MCKCGATFEIASGEYVSPCNLEKGHDGSHKGGCLGSVFRWQQGFHSEYEMYIKDLEEFDDREAD